VINLITRSKQICLLGRSLKICEIIHWFKTVYRHAVILQKVGGHVSLGWVFPDLSDFCSWIRPLHQINILWSSGVYVIVICSNLHNVIFLWSRYRVVPVFLELTNCLSAQPVDSRQVWRLFSWLTLTVTGGTWIDGIVIICLNHTNKWILLVNSMCLENRKSQQKVRCELVIILKVSAYIYEIYWNRDLLETFTFCCNLFNVYVLYK